MAKLEEIRRRSYLSQRDLAEKAKVAPSTVHLIEAGKNPRPRPSVMRRISEALGVSPAEVDEFRSAVERVA